MTARLLLLCLLSPLAALAQLQLFLFDGSVEKPVTGITDIGTVAAGDARDVRIRVRNNGTSPVALTTVTLAGQGFTVTSAPSLPFIVAALNVNFAEVRVRFSAATTGSYSATLAANTLQTILHTTVVNSATIAVVNDTAASLLASGGTLDFGRVQKGHSASLNLRIANGTTTAMTIQSCAVAGSAFQATGLQCPLTLAPGDAVTVTVVFNPTTAASQTGTLSFDSRSFPLSGTGFDPPLPKPSVDFAAPLSSGAQQRLSIGLAAASEASGNGTVTLEFQPVPGAGDDPAICFTGSGSRNLSFQVNEGDRAGNFPAGVNPVFQTGTTAGAIVFHVKLGEYSEQFSFPVAPAAVYIDHGSATRRTADLDVSLTGFDNTRTAGRFSFTFFDASGKPVQQGPISADWTPVFANYFSASKVGGSFMMRATFPVSGNALQITGVEVEMTNSAGVTRTTRMTF